MITNNLEWGKVIIASQWNSVDVHHWFLFHILKYWSQNILEMFCYTNSIICTIRNNCLSVCTVHNTNTTVWNGVTLGMLYNWSPGIYMVWYHQWLKAKRTTKSNPQKWRCTNYSNGNKQWTVWIFSKLQVQLDFLTVDPHLQLSKMTLMNL